MIPEPALALTPEEEAIVAAGVEPEGISARAIIKLAVGTFVFLTLAVIAVIFWIKVTEHAREQEVTGMSQPVMLRQANADAQRLLTQYGVVDAEQGIYRIPIDRAMELVVQENGQ